MFDNLYVTSRNYVYNKNTCRIFKVSTDVRKILLKYNGADELKQNDYLTYQSFHPILEQLTHSENLNNHYDESILSSLQLVICNECNLACKYCYAHSGTYDRSEKAMDLQTAINAIDIIFTKYKAIDTIVFFGGEPLLYVDLIEKICEYLFSHYDNRFSHIGMMSNLYHLTDDAIRVIKKYNIEVATSLDGNETLNSYRVNKHGENSYNHVVNNIQKLYDESKQPSAIEVTMSNLHSDIGYNAISITDELAKMLPVKNYTVNTVTDFDGRMADRLYNEKHTPTIVAVNKFIDEGICEMRINDLVAVITGNTCGDILCNAGSAQFSIFPNGDIFPCHIYALDKEKRFCLGNVNNFQAETFENARKKVAAFNSKSSYSKCQNCDAFNICTSCMGMELTISSELPHDDAFCVSQRKYFDELIEIYAELLDNPERFFALKERLKEATALCLKN